MKVIDLQFYRRKKIIEDLEKRMGQIILSSEFDTARKMKLNFKIWLQKRVS